MNNEYWILNKNRKIKKVDLMTWAKWFKSSQDRIIGKDIIKGIRVSTVFLGIDHGFGLGKPILFETIIFGSNLKKLQGYQERYHTLQEAEKGHKDAIEFVNSILK